MEKYQNTWKLRETYGNWRKPLMSLVGISWELCQTWLTGSHKISNVTGVALAQVDLHRVWFWTDHHVCGHGNAGSETPGWNGKTCDGVQKVLKLVLGVLLPPTHFPILEPGSTSCELAWKPLWRWPPESRFKTPRRRGWRSLEIDSPRKVMNIPLKQPFYSFNEVDFGHLPILFYRCVCVCYDIVMIYIVVPLWPTA